MSIVFHARRATGLIGAEREESLTRTESVARWSREGRAAYEAERRSAVRFLFSPAQGIPTRRKIENNYIRGDGDHVFFLKFLFSFFP